MRSVRIGMIGAWLFLGAGCDNNPHARPWCEKREDGSPWVVTYRGLPDDPRTLDPQVSYDVLGHRVISLVYESPLQYHPFKNHPYELTPCLLEKMPERLIREGEKVSYRLRLKKGLRFHDDPCFVGTRGVGREVIAEDLRYAFQRMSDPKVECPVLSIFQEIFPGMAKVYAQAGTNGFFDYGQPIEGLTVEDRYTLRLDLAKPYPQLLYWLAMPFTAPIPREAVEYYDGKIHEKEVRPLFRFHPVGTGPFQMVEWRKGRLIRLVRNARYTATVFPEGGWERVDEERFRPWAGHALPLLDEVQMDVIRESIPYWLLFRQGYLESTGVGKDVFNTVMSVGNELSKEQKSRGVVLDREVEAATYFMVFNMNDPVLGKNKKLRQAISMGYDEDLANQTFANGRNLKAEQLLPPGVFGYQPDLKNRYRNFDLDQARRLLADAGYPGGVDSSTGRALEMSLDVTGDDAESRQFAEFNKNQIEQLGIKVKLIENIWAGQQEKMDKGHFQLMGYGWNADYPDPENFFMLFITANLPPKGSNHSRYSNSEFDRLFEKMSVMDNGSERLKLIARMTAILNEDCPVIWQSHPVQYVLFQPWAPRVVSSSMVGGSAKYLTINPVLRARLQKDWK